MHSTYNEIERAVGEAVDHVRSLKHTFPAIELFDQDYLRSLKSQPDDTPLHCMDQALTPPAPGHVLVGNTSALAAAHWALGRMTKIPIPRTLIDTNVSHEDEHADHMRARDYRDILYGLAVTGVTRKTVSFQPYVIGTAPHILTKLELAGVIAAPTVPSRGDAHDIALMGYKNRADIVQRLKRRGKLQ